MSTNLYPTEVRCQKPLFGRISDQGVSGASLIRIVLKVEQTILFYKNNTSLRKCIKLKPI